MEGITEQQNLPYCDSRQGIECRISNNEVFEKNLMAIIFAGNNLSSFCHYTYFEKGLAIF